ncbi:MAG: Serine/threonine kinase [Myxococcales bacterium]|nr:Serine/threonine kinase [Myxococcales bacterium]
MAAKCPDDNLLMAMAHRTLDGHQLHEVEVHIDSCRECRLIVAAAVGDGPTALGTPPPKGDTEPSESILDLTINERYVIESLLGRGGMGTVYLARDLSLGREVALKLHRAGSGNDRLHREAIAMAKLAHPNVVTVFEVGTFEDRLYVAMEYVRGETLRGWLASAPRSWREIVELLLHAGDGLAAAHAAGLVHRDFKPENVLVGDGDRPRVSDFGLARVDTRPSGPIAPVAGTSSLDTPITQTGALMGTPAYMAPEQLASGAIDARSDQFAFCVVAWECLFGSRPFAGSTLAAIAIAIERQELQRPARTDVPPRVRELIERGLLVDPAGRHADMPALLAALREAVAPRFKRRAAIGIGAAVILASATVFAALAMTNDAETQCAVDEHAFADVWDPTLTAKMHTAFSAAGVKGSDQIFEHVSGIFDTYRGSWIAMRRSSCEATRLRGEQSEALLDLRMSCLDHRRDELRALAHALAEADHQAVIGSVRAAFGLTPISECADILALSGPVRPPEQQIRERVEAARSELAAAKALRLLGRVGPALEKTEMIAAQSKELNYRPLDAEALLMLGDLKDRSGDTAAGIKLVEQAVVAADAGNHRLVAAQAWSNLAWMQGYEQRQFERAEFAVRMAAAAIESLGGNAELSAQLTNYEALILETKGQLEPAYTKYLAALAARERMHQPESWQMALVLNDLGSVERKLNKFAAARAHHERALAIRRTLFGEVHPYVFSSLLNLGNVAWSEGDYPQAEQRFQAAIAVADEVFPAMHPQKAKGLANLGSVFEKQAKYQESVQAYRRALAIYESVRGPDHADVADTLHNLGNVLATIGQTEEAIRDYERALAIVEKGDDDPSLASVLYDFGDVLVRTKDSRRAESLLQRSITIGSKAHNDDPDLAYALTALGELYTTLGRTHEAGPLLERALLLRQAESVSPDERARTEIALAKLLWRSAADHPRALELARAAKTHLVPTDPRQRKPYEEVAQWLERRE